MQLYNAYIHSKVTYGLEIYGKQKGKFKQDTEDPK